MKYKKKSEEIDAVPFQWGMEDGVIRYNCYIEKEVGFPADMYSTKYPGYLARYENELDSRCFDQHEGYVPYIATLEGFNRIPENGYIITEQNGNRYPMRSELFTQLYEKVSLTE